jgi:hypothetical protein
MVPGTVANQVASGEVDASSLTARGSRYRFGPYWVVAIGPGNEASSQSYDWAIISGGPPKFASTGGGCSTVNPMSTTGGVGVSVGPLNISVGMEGVQSGNKAYGEGGLWFFSHKPVDPEGFAKMKAVAEKLGLSTSGLKAVQQENCTYEGA